MANTKELRWNAEQARLITELKIRTKRFMLIQAGRRSGKTDLPSRCFYDRILDDWRKHGIDMEGGYYYITAPTYGQVKRIWWERIKRAIPKYAQVKTYEGTLEIVLIFGCRIVLAGLDKPERIEGPPCLGILSDEWANCKPGTFENNILPALGDTNGWFIAAGVPRPSLLYDNTLALIKKNPHEWHHFKWSSEDILSESAINTYKTSMDEITYSIEIKGERTEVKGRVYYAYDEDMHDFKIEDDMYVTKEPLLLCFDFNVSPGVAIIMQEKRMDNDEDTKFQAAVDVLLDEIWIPVNSNTNIVIDEIVQRYIDHEGLIYVYGDATGGADKTSATMGSDWRIISNVLNKIYPGRVNMFVKRGNPPVSDRINATNAKIKNAHGEIGMILDAQRNPQVKRDLEMVQYLEGTARKIDPKPGGDTSLGHILDAYGYSVEFRYPIYFDEEDEKVGGRFNVNSVPQIGRRRR